MTDYIKREDVKHVINKSKYYGKKVWYDILDDVYDIPSADVAPVRHGRWEKNNYLFLDTLYRCSVCGEEFYLENGTPQENQYYYCPNCGARMDGEDDETD